MSALAGLALPWSRLPGFFWLVLAVCLSILIVLSTLYGSKWLIREIRKI